MALLAGTSQAAFPGQNGQIVFVRVPPPSSGVYVINPDGTGLNRIYASATPNVSNTSWSPDGGHIVFLDASTNFDGVIRVVDASGGGLRTVLAGSPGSPTLSVSWTPDGRISYIVHTFGTCLTVEGAAQPLVCVHPRPGEVLGSLRERGRWSSTGGLGWISSRYPPPSFETGDEIVLVDAGVQQITAGGPGETPVTATRVSRFDWSPDGTRVALGLVPAGIAVVNADGSGEHVISKTGFMPAWSPDGKKIVFATTEGLRIMNADGSNVVTLTTTADAGDVSPDWQPAAHAYLPPSTGTTSTAPAAKPKTMPVKKPKPTPVKKPKPK